LIGLTFFCLKNNDYSFGSRTRYIHYLGLFAISTFTIWVFYRSLDELLTIFTVVSWDPSLISLTFKSLTFWFGKILSYFIIFLGLSYLFNFLELKKFFKLRWFSWLIFYFVMFIQRWSVSVFRVDYAVLTGLERITVFWKFYPLLYISYAILYLSVFKGGLF